MKSLVLERGKYDEIYNEFEITSSIFKSDIVNISEKKKELEDK
jgi:hypothetical protein